MTHFVSKIVFGLIVAFVSLQVFAINTIPGESTYCSANCPGTTCLPYITALGNLNYTFGEQIWVCNPAGTDCAWATTYKWSWNSGSYGTPTNLTGIGTDYTDTYAISQVVMPDSGIYAETGYNYGLNSAGVTNLYCLTVNPIAVLNGTAIQ